MAKRSGETLAYMDLMRIFTVLALIMLFLSQTGKAGVDSGTASWQIFHIYEGFTRWAVPGLMMLCGAFALERGGDLRGAGLELVLPCFLSLVIWSALYGVVGHLLAGGRFTLWGLWSAIQSAALGDTLSHLWILYPLLGLYLVTPVLGRFAVSASRGELIYFLALSLLFAGLLPIWNTLHPNTFWAELLTRLQVHLVLGYAGCYMAGYYFRTFVISRVSEIILYVLGIAGLVVTFWGSRLFGGGWALWFGYTTPNVTFTAIAFFVLFRYVLGISDERSRKQSMRRLGGTALGIYLIHQIIALIFRHFFGLTVFSLPAVAAIPLLALLLFALSAPFALLRGMLPWVRQGGL